MKRINKQYFLRLYKAHPLEVILLGTTFLSFLYFCIGINSWKFSSVGDNWQFYSFALDIAQKNLLVNPLSTHGVFSEYAVLGSWYQGIFLYLLGASHFAWILSS